MKHLSLTGLVAATHTPFHADGSLNLAVVEELNKRTREFNALVEKYNALAKPAPVKPTP